MAAAVEDSSFLSCCICYHKYTKEVVPATLSCGHTFCYTCLLSIHQPTCPTCRKKFPRNSVSVNHDLQAIIASISPVKPKPQEADSICETCFFHCLSNTQTDDPIIMLQQNRALLCDSCTSKIQPPTLQINGNTSDFLQYTAQKPLEEKNAVTKRKRTTTTTTTTKEIYSQFNFLTTLIH